MFSLSGPIQASSGINGVDPVKALAGVDSIERFELDILNGDGESDRKDGDTSHVHTLAALSGDALQFIRDRCVHVRVTVHFCWFSAATAVVYCLPLVSLRA
jgi:hypothetical protein